MTHRFPIKEIAQQSGLSTATVDRVINGRANVSQQTKTRVSTAIEELKLQEGQLAARGMRMFVDFVVEAPRRFSSKIRNAVEQVIPHFSPAVIRPRFTFQEEMTEAQTIAHIDRIIGRGSSGVFLKVRDLPAIHDAVTRLRDKKIPVVTMFTDLQTERLAYVGADNYQAGQTAAYLMLQSLGATAKGPILMIKSQDSFAGEELRAAGFKATIAGHGLRLMHIAGASGLTTNTAVQIKARAVDFGPLAGVYSMGGGNRATLETLAAVGLEAGVFVGHDLDEENIILLRGGRLHYVLEHDLCQDLETGFAHVCHAHGLGPAPTKGTSVIQVVTPFQLP